VSTRPPIFVLGVPRSGTTLLRVMLDSHPAIACGPETPWLCGHQPRSVMELCRLMTDESQGYCASFGMPRQVVTDSAQEFVSRLMDSYARGRGKSRWAEKTPDNALHVDFLLELYPGARFIYIVRDGLDVAASTSCPEETNKGISDWHKRKIVLTERAVTNNNPFTALLRWAHWNRLVERSLSGREHLRISYERLVSEPEATLREVCEHIGEPFDGAMLGYANVGHDMPAWEWGSADVRARPTVTGESLGRAQRILSPAELEILAPIAGRDREQPPRPAAAIGSVDDLTQDRYRLLLRWLNHFGQPLGLRTHIRSAKVWESPWLWFNAAGLMKHQDLRVVDIASDRSPVPWVLALLGARVVLVERDDANVAHWRALRERLRVDVEWIVGADDPLALADGSADLVLSTGGLDACRDRRAMLGDVARVLRPGGVLAFSFDLCEPKMDMALPPGSPPPMTLGHFEKVMWMHPAFGNSAAPEWNRADLRRFRAWRSKSAEERNSAVGAAVMIRTAG
jgi:protein-tyrosine sulfotransferase